MASEISDAGAASPGPSPAGYDRMPPYNLEAEESILGSMLLSKHAIADVSEIVGPGDFYRGAHRTMFEVARDLDDAGEPVDQVTLADALVQRGQLADVGGAIAIAEIAEKVPTPANATYYARIVADHAARRRLIDVGTRIVKLGFELELGVDEAVDAAEAAVFDVAHGRRRGGDFTPMRELLSQTFEVLERLSLSNDTITGLETGFVDFDDLTAGLQPGNLVVIAARPAMGKSTLVTNILTHVTAQLRQPAVLFSLEMSDREIVQRMLSAVGRIPSERLRNGRLRDNDWQDVAKAMGQLAEAPLFIDDTPGISLMEIRSKARRLKQAYGLSLIVVDYLQLMMSHRTVDSRVQEVAEFSRGLKILAKELDCPVVALSQLSRKPEERQDKRPLLADLRESGSIEQDADLVCFIYREDAYRTDESEHTGEAELIVSKHRNGPTKTIRLAFIGKHARFANIARGIGGPPPPPVPAATGPSGSSAGAGGHLRPVPPHIPPSPI